MADNKYLEKIASSPLQELPAKLIEKAYPYAIGAAVGGGAGTVFSNKDTQSASHIGGMVMGALAGGALGHAGVSLARHSATKAMLRKADFSRGGVHTLKERIAHHMTAGALAGGVAGGAGAAAIQAKRNEKYKHRS